MKILVIDNYDSFTFNLVHYLRELGCEVTIKRNDQIKMEEVENYDKIVLSPGPGIPEEAGLLKPIIAQYAPSKSILGVCLGHQAIGEVFGGTLKNLDTVFHGVSTKVTPKVNNEKLFNNLQNSFDVGRYHSWVIANDNFPEDLEITSIDDQGQIMSLRHKKYDVRGVQFHPESILTPDGKTMLKNWLDN